MAKVATATKRTVGDYVVMKHIGSGSFAHVFQAHHKDDADRMVAIKAIELSKIKHAKHTANMASEIAILQSVQHPNIVRLLETLTTERHIYLVMEYCAGGDLGARVRKKGKIPESQVRALARQLICGYKFLYERKLMHRDLKSHNLLLDASGTLKIADFGFARYFSAQDMAATICGSPLYMAPEILKGEKYDERVDLWSLGVVLWELLLGAPPYSADNQVQLLRKIETAPLCLTDQQARLLSSQAQHLLLSLLRPRAADRMTFPQCFAHAFFSEPQPSTALAATVRAENKPADLPDAADPEPPPMLLTQTVRASALKLLTPILRSTVIPIDNYWRRVESERKAQHPSQLIVSSVQASSSAVSTLPVVERTMVAVTGLAEARATVFAQCAEAALASERFFVLDQVAPTQSDLLIDACAATLVALRPITAANAAFVLYVRALELVRSKSGSIATSEGAYVYFICDTDRDDCRSVMLCLRADQTQRLFNVYSAKVTELRMRFPATVLSECVCAEKIVYDMAIHLAHGAAVSAMRDRQTLAAFKFELGRKLLATLRQHDGIDQHDQLVLDSLLAAISAQLVTLSKSRRP